MKSLLEARQERQSRGQTWRLRVGARNTEKERSGRDVGGWNSDCWVNIDTSDVLLCCFLWSLLAIINHTLKSCCTRRAGLTHGHYHCMFISRLNGLVCSSVCLCWWWQVWGKKTSVPLRQPLVNTDKCVYMIYMLKMFCIVGFYRKETINLQYGLLTLKL